MKKNMISLLLALCLLTGLILPTQAADYGKLSDETDRMDQEAMAEYGNEILPMFEEFYGLDVRVDILPVTPEKDWDPSMGQVIYEDFEYGAGPGKNGISLTILAYPDETGLALNQWYLYAGGTSEELKATAISTIQPQLEPLLTPDFFLGDLQSDMAAVDVAIQVFMTATEEYILSGNVAGTIYDPETDTKLDAQTEPAVTEEPVTEATETPETTEAPIETEAPVETEAEIPTVEYIFGNVEIMDLDTVLALEEKADAISQKYQAGVYFVAVSDFRDVAGDPTIEDAAESCYGGLELGMGPQKDGILLLVSTDTREYIVTVNGTLRESLGHAGTEYMKERFLPFLSDTDWVGAAEAMMDSAAELLEQAAQGHPIAKEAAKTPVSAYVIGVVVCLGIGFLIALLVVQILKGQLRSVEQKVEAHDYLTGSGADIQESYDNFSHTTTTRTYDPPQKSKDSDSGSSGSSNSSSGSF